MRMKTFSFTVWEGTKYHVKMDWDPDEINGDELKCT
jgi:hypothetical protein